MTTRNAWSLAILGATLSLVLSCAATDAGLTTKVQAKFAADDIVNAALIGVTTNDGTVTLTGNVDNEEAKIRALALARSTSGVTNVIDEISARWATAGQGVSDAGLTRSVMSRFIDDPMVNSLRIDVATRDGVVFLTGTVGSDAEKRRAIQLAKDTKGVRDVKANLTQTRS